MKPIEIRQMTDEELAQMFDESSKELFNLRLQQSLGQLEKPDRIKALRRDIARANTILTQRRKGLGPDGKLEVAGSDKSASSEKVAATATASTEEGK